MKTEGKTMQIVKKSDLQAEKVKKRERILNLITDKINKKTEELKTKKYIIEGGVTTANKLIQFLTTEAEWKFTESLGIIESIKQLSDAVEKASKSKNQNIFVDPLALEAIYYFLAKGEGKGLTAAEKYLLLLKPVSDALNRNKEHRAELDQMLRDQGTLQHALDNGADVENEDAILLEIEKELSKELK